MQSFFPAMTKIVGTLGPKSRSVDVISGCLKAGMSGRFFFFSFNNLLFCLFVFSNSVLAFRSKLLVLFAFNCI